MASYAMAEEALRPAVRRRALPGRGPSICSPRAASWQRIQDIKSQRRRRRSAHRAATEAGSSSAPRRPPRCARPAGHLGQSAVPGVCPSMIAKTLAAVLVAFGLAAAVTQPAAAQQDPALSDQQVEAVRKMVKAYLMEHPEVISDAVEALREKMRVQAETDAKKAIDTYKDELNNAKDDPVAGNPKGDVTLVEFFDYNCGFCKQTMDAMFEAAKADGKVKLVFKEFPILTDNSVVAARVALAAKKQGKYDEIHRAFMKFRGRLDEKEVWKLAAEAGLNIDQIKRDMARPRSTSSSTATRSSRMRWTSAAPPPSSSARASCRAGWSRRCSASCSTSPARAATRPRSSNTRGNNSSTSCRHAREGGHPWLRQHNALNSSEFLCPGMDPRLRGGDGWRLIQMSHYAGSDSPQRHKGSLRLRHRGTKGGYLRFPSCLCAFLVSLW